ncbi:hypothetical protein INT47_011224 [Mucor saturninus]|uniref:Uncharacterized protein n=1 Tax=Mucor saturninus TaxID=64648 RepID=A0A8H7RMD1_9FUNG|nr:hypothetical protein INT47_011224 [Mucor saturninus]
MGHWSAPNTRFYELIRGHGFRRLLQKAEVLKRFGWSITRALINEEQILMIVLRLWNHDMPVCLNMVDIVRSLRAGNDIPAQDFDVERL